MVQLDLAGLALLGLLLAMGWAAAAVLLADAERLPFLAREGMARLLGEVRLQELLELQQAWERRMLSPFQLQALRVIGGALGALPGVIAFLARGEPRLALVLAVLGALVGVLVPGRRFHQGLARADIRAAELDALGFVARLRHELVMGTPLEGAIRGYVQGERGALARLLSGVPMSAGADPVSGVREMIRRTDSRILVPIAASLGAIERARSPESVLINMQERVRATLVGQLREENSALQLRLLAEVVGLMLVAMLLLVFGAILVRLTSVGVF